MKDRLEEDEYETDEEFEESEDDLHICFHEMHIFHDTKRARADCVSVFSDREGQIGV